MAATKAVAGNGHRVMALDELLAQPLPYEDVPTPEYGADASVRLYAVTGTRRAELAEQNDTPESTTPGGRLRFVHELVAASMGGDATAEQVGGLPSAVIDRLSKTALRLAGIGEDAVDKATEDSRDSPERRQWLTLARRSGRSVAAIQAGLTSVEATEWLASARLDPDEADRADIRHALLMDLMVRLAWRSKRPPRVAPHDFLAALPWRPEYRQAAAPVVRPQTPADLRAKIDAVMRTLGGKKSGR